MPEHVEHVWEWFWALSAQRAGSEPLRFADITAWSLLTRTSVRPEEIDLLLAMDGAYRQALGVEKHELQQRIEEKRTAAQAAPGRRRGRRR